MVLWVPAFESLYGKFDQRIGHYRRYRRNELLALVHNVGFQQVTARYTNMPGFFAWWLLVRVLRTSPTGPRLTSFHDRLLHSGHPPRGTFRAATSRSVVAGRRAAVVDDAVDRGPAGTGARAVSNLVPTSRRSTDSAGLRSSPCCSSTPASCKAASSASTCSSRSPGFLITSLLLAEVDVTGRVDVDRVLGTAGSGACLPAVLLLAGRGHRDRDRSWRACRNAQRR